jgi:hypothetical protein
MARGRHGFDTPSVYDMSLSLVLSTQATPIYVDPSSSQAPFPPGIPAEILQSIEDPVGLVQVGRK